MPSVNDWLALFNDIKQSKQYLKEDYGENYSQFESKRQIIIDLLNLHKRSFGNEEVIIIRAPGRINLMGRHVDHQGGNVNLIAIDQEIFITASIRDDFKIFAYNIDEIHFNKVEIDFSKFNSDLQGDWIGLINNEVILGKYRSASGNWANFIKAAYFRLLNLYGINEIFGANICASGNIMIAAGLSSSTALTIGIFEALSKLNNKNMEDEDVIKLCAEAEWFVGTRGGSADQVAIKLAKPDQIIHVRLFPLEIIDWLKFPKKYDLLIFNSKILADKSGSKKDLYNEKVLAYEIGFNLIKIKFPEYISKLQYLRDVNPENLDTKPEIIIKILSEIPEYIEYQEISKILGAKWHEIKQHYQFTNPPHKIPIRKIISYGIAECERSKKFYKFIKEGTFLSAGKLMNISHDGDRVFIFNNKLDAIPYNNELNNVKLQTQLQNNISLDQITGGYGASIPEIDFVIDLTKNYHGVLGAQLSGAGLGGCAMILVENDRSEKVRKLIYKNYKNKFGTTCIINVSKPVKGLSVYDKIK
jgi:N-acetylgalactosamine kinase